VVTSDGAIQAETERDEQSLKIPESDRSLTLRNLGENLANRRRAEPLPRAGIGWEQISEAPDTHSHSIVPGGLLVTS
jgi:hypothetical protein